MGTFVREAILALLGSGVAIITLVAILEYVPDGQFQGRLLLLWFASLLVVPLLAKKISKYVRNERGTEP